VRRRGYAATDEELEEGLSSVAAPGQLTGTGAPGSRERDRLIRRAKALSWL
jgi:hypothetical protein